MKRKIHTFALAVFFLWIVPVSTEAARLLIPGGQIIGLQLQTGTVTVAAFDDALGAAARDSGLRIGDELLQVNGRDVACAEDVRSALGDPGAEVSICVRRDGKTHTLKITPRQTEQGPRLGIHLKQGITGIGTLTWYDPATGKFGTLGHGVSDSRGGFLKMTAGNAYRAEITGVRKGKSGDPGLLKGSADALGICGSLLKNTPQGVFGISKTGWQGEPLPTADYQEIQTGEAAIRSTVSGSGIQEYSVEILKIYPEDRSDGRNFLLRVTDPSLLKSTGGIVQGMSGSPIIQNGRLIGAVTHVLVNQPDTGYGIFIENMLQAAE